MGSYSFTVLSFPGALFGVYASADFIIKNRERDSIVAKLLTCIPSFYDDILKLRVKHSIVVKSIVGDHSTHSNRRIAMSKDEAFSLLYAAELDPDVEVGVRSLLIKYKLSERWLDPLMSLVSYDVLVLPIEDIVSADLSDDPSYLARQGLTLLRKTNRDRKWRDEHPINVKPADLLNLADFENKLAQSLNPETVPVRRKLIITVTEQISPTDLANWIKSSKDVKQQLTNLYKTPYSLIGKNGSALFWGHFVWVHKEFVAESSDDGYGAAESWLTEQFANVIDVPGSRELGIYYRRFMRARNRFIP
jgi:hypothetical protein